MSRSNANLFTHRLMALALCLFFAVFLIWPMWEVIHAGFIHNGHFTAQYMRLIFSDPQLLRGLRNAALVAVTVTFLCLMLSLPLAVLSVRYKFPGQALLSGLLLAPLVLPPFVGAIGIRLILGRYGPITMLLGLGSGAGFDWIGRFRLLGIVLVETLHLYPVMLLNLQAALANIDPAMEQAAANLGAPRSLIFRKITLPLLRPGLFAGCTLVLIWSFTELGTPLVFDFNTITPVQIFWQITEVAANPLPYALVVVMLAAAGGLYLIGKVLLGTGASASATKGMTAADPKPLRGFRAFAAVAFFVIVLALALLPHAAVILTSFSATGQWYRSVLPRQFTLNHYTAALLDDLAIPSVRNSVLYATAATILAVVIGISAAILIVRSRLRSRRLHRSPLHAPPGCPRLGPRLRLSRHQRLPQTKIRPPTSDLAGRPRETDSLPHPRLRRPPPPLRRPRRRRRPPADSRRSGTGRRKSRRKPRHGPKKITLKLIAGNLIAGALLAFAFALLEVSDSLILAQKAAYFPITRAILELAQRLGDGLYIASAPGRLGHAAANPVPPGRQLPGRQTPRPNVPHLTEHFPAPWILSPLPVLGERARVRGRGPIDVVEPLRSTFIQFRQPIQPSTILHSPKGT